MKQIVTVVLLTLSATAFAQPKVMTQAVITTKTVVSAPEEDEAMPSSMQSSNGEEVRVMRFGGDGETKTTTWLKNDSVKTFSESESSRTTAIRDNAKKMGSKMLHCTFLIDLTSLQGKQEADFMQFY